MSRIRGFDTKVEIKLRTALQKKRLRFKSNVQSLPGRPDFVFQRAHLIVFVDGNFWHGFQYPQWKGRLSPFWQAKIERNRARDVRNHRKLRRAGWKVIRLWEHQVMRDVDGCVELVVREVRRRIVK